jgi:hypothetical protein
VVPVSAFDAVEADEDLGAAESCVPPPFWQPPAARTAAEAAVRTAPVRTRRAEGIFISGLPGSKLTALTGKVIVLVIAKKTTCELD